MWPAWESGLRYHDVRAKRRDDRLPDEWSRRLFCPRDLRRKSGHRSWSATGRGSFAAIATAKIENFFGQCLGNYLPFPQRTRPGRLLGSAPFDFREG